MPFFQETNRSIKIFIILLSIVWLISSLYSSDPAGQIIGLVLLYCGIKFNYLIKKSPYIIIGTLGLLLLRGFIETVANFQQTGWLKFILSTIFSVYLIVSVIKLAKKQNLKPDKK